MKILFIEDEDLLRSLFSEAFNIDDEYTYALTGANDLQSGWLKLKEMPHVVILDLMIPYKKETSSAADLREKLGLQLLKNIKNDPVVKNIPVIIFSNLNDTEIQKQALELGAAAYLVKSKTTPEQFLATIKRVAL